MRPASNRLCGRSEARRRTARSARELAAGEGEPAEPDATAGRRRYTTSKLCNVLCTYELDRRLRSQGREGISVNAYDPGLMPGTGLARNYSGLQRFVWRFVIP